MQLDNEYLYRLLELGGTAAVLWFVLVRVEAAIKEQAKALTELRLSMAVLIDRHIQAQMETRAAVKENTAAVKDELGKARHADHSAVQ